MAVPRGLILDLFLVAVLAVLGAGAGLLAVRSPSLTPDSLRRTPERVYPLPHHVAKYPGGVSLRLAMVHDTIHERYPKHGQAFYEERNRLREEALRQEEAEQARGATPTKRYFELIDDLAVGHERLGRHEEAIRLMCRKLQRQEELGWSGRNLYSSYANLGTFLILRQLDRGFADRESAKEQVRASADLVRKSIELNPEAHFGREEWQLTLLEFLLVVLDKPELLLRFDMVGNLLNKPLDFDQERAYILPTVHGGVWLDLRMYLENSEGTDRLNPEERTRLRGAITKVGAGQGWTAAVPRAHSNPVSFDEPVLGIIGMWQYGGGANPHFALALAEVMLRVGQRYIAWCGFERAALLAPRISDDPDMVRRFTEYCRRRQTEIEKSLPAEEVARLRPRFEAELAFGQRYQQAYQDYEARRIREGASLDDPHFYDAFHAEQKTPIASPVGPEEEVVFADRHYLVTTETLSAMLFGAGVFAFVGACLVRFRRALLELIGFLKRSDTVRSSTGETP
jgi:hypothetical protein